MLSIRLVPVLVSGLLPALIPCVIHSASAFSSGATRTHDEGLTPAVEQVLRMDFTDLDTASLMQALRQRASWGETDERYTEAEALLLYTQGQWGLAYVKLKGLARPGAEALGILAECLDRKGDIYASALYHLRAARRFVGQPSKQVEHLQRYLRVYPKKDDVRLEMGQSYAANHQYHEAAETFLQVEPLWIQDSLLAFSVLDWLFKSGRIGDQEKLLGRIRQAQPHIARWTRLHAELLGKLGEHEAAGRVSMMGGDYKQAQGYFEEYRNRHPGSPIGYAGVGMCLALAQDLDLAAEPLQKAIDLGSKDESVWVHRARAYREAGERDIAESMLSYLRSQDSKWPGTWIWSARFAREDGQEEMALRFEEKAEQLEPGNSIWPDAAQPMIGFMKEP